MRPLTVIGVLFTIAAVIIGINAIVGHHRDPDHETGGLMSLAAIFLVTAVCAFFPNRVGEAIQSIVNRTQ